METPNQCQATSQKALGRKLKKLSANFERQLKASLALQKCLTELHSVAVQNAESAMDMIQVLSLALERLKELKSKMKTPLLTILLCSLAFGESLRNRDIAAMVHAKVPQAEILQRIAHCEEQQFSLWPEDTQALTRAGVNEELIRAMAARQNGRPFAGTPSVAPAVVPVIVPAKPRQANSFDREEIFIGYSYLSADIGDGTRWSFNGWESAVAYNVSKWASIEGNVSGYYKTNILGSGFSAHDYSFLAGPRFNFRPGFVHVLIGLDRLTGTAYDLSSSENAFASAVGGGFQVNVSRHVAMRSSIDYVLTRHGGESQNHFRVGGGVVYTFTPSIAP